MLMSMCWNVCNVSRDLDPNISGDDELLDMHKPTLEVISLDVRSGTHLHGPSGWIYAGKEALHPERAE